MQNLQLMPASTMKVRIALVRSWTKPIVPLHAELRAAGFAAQIIRVDIEPALNAAFGRGKLDAVVFDPATRAISRSLLDALMRNHRLSCPIVEIDRLELLGAALRRSLAPRIN